MEQYVLLIVKYEFLREEGEYFLNLFMKTNNINSGMIIKEDEYSSSLNKLRQDKEIAGVFIIPSGLFALKPLIYDKNKTTDFGYGALYLCFQDEQKAILKPSQIQTKYDGREELSNYLFHSPLNHLAEYNEYAYGVLNNSDLAVYVKYIKGERFLVELNEHLEQKTDELQALKSSALQAKQSKIVYRIKRMADYFRRKKQRIYLNLTISGKLYLVGKSELVQKDANLNISGKLNPELQKIIGNFYFVKFNYEKLADLDGVVYNFMVEVNGENRRIKNRKYDKRDNYNNIYSIYRSKDYVYYTRNTASGNVVIQKKLRYYFEDKYFASRVLIGYLLSKFSRTNLVFFEKNISQFDSNAKYVFDNCQISNKYIALRKDVKDYSKVKAKYGKQVIEPGTIRYYTKVFSCKYAVGSEITSHLGTLRNPNKLLRRKLQQKKLIFLQHGIMMSISLHTNERLFFRKGEYYNIEKFVVSSQAEANHVKAYGLYNEENIWRTGLSSFDYQQTTNEERNYVTILYTWRSYEEASKDIKQTTYYKDVMETYQLAYAKYGERVRLVWHPKMSEYMTINQDESINEILSKTKVLITDYSSVAFDAFYRGATVIFDWRNKENVMKQLNSSLMFNEKMAFGEVIYSLDNFVECLEQNYQSEQTIENQEKYQFFNEYNDNRNTERIVQELDKLFK